jgi:hypothetical protein
MDINTLDLIEKYMMTTMNDAIATLELMGATNIRLNVENDKIFISGDVDSKTTTTITVNK